MTNPNKLLPALNFRGVNRVALKQSKKTLESIASLQDQHGNTDFSYSGSRGLVSNDLMTMRNDVNQLRTLYREALANIGIIVSGTPKIDTMIADSAHYLTEVNKALQGPSK